MSEAFIGGGGGGISSITYEYKTNNGQYGSIAFDVSDCDLAILSAGHCGGSPCSAYCFPKKSQIVVTNAPSYGSVVLSGNSLIFDCGSYYHTTAATCTKIKY